MPLASVNGIQIKYEIDDFTDPWLDKSSVPTVLMHHAFFRGLTSLAGWVPRLAKHYRVIRYDSCGFGGSSARPLPFSMTMEQLAEDARGLMDYLEIAKVHFMGVSSGGIAGQILAASHPDRVISLTLCDSPHKLNEEVKLKLSAGESSPSAAIRKFGILGWREKTMESTLDPKKVDRRMMDWQVEQQIKVPLHICASMEQSLETADTTGILEKIRCPTLIMGGDRSVFTPLEMLVFMARRIPSCRLQVFPGIGSTLSVTHGEACSASVLEFITEVDRRVG
jgi:pimeloyl-ACP methyl ester carboxylesterase